MLILLLFRLEIVVLLNKLGWSKWFLLLNIFVLDKSGNKNEISSEETNNQSSKKCNTSIRPTLFSIWMVLKNGEWHYNNNYIGKKTKKQKLYERSSKFTCERRDQKKGEKLVFLVKTESNEYEKVLTFLKYYWKLKPLKAQKFWLMHIYTYMCPLILPSIRFQPKKIVENRGILEYILDIIPQK